MFLTVQKLNLRLELHDYALRMYIVVVDRNMKHRQQTNLHNLILINSFSEDKSNKKNTHLIGISGTAL